MNKLRLISGKIRSAVFQHPVEITLSIIFYLLWLIYKLRENNSDILFIFPILLSGTIFCNNVFKRSRKTRWIYYLSLFTFIPLLFIQLKTFIDSPGYFYALLLSAILVISCGWYKDNRKFAWHALYTIFNILSGAIIAYTLQMAIFIILESFAYIFTTGWNTWKFHEYTFAFISFIVWPTAFFFQNNNKIHEAENKNQELSNVSHILLDYILSPALIIYTVILYIYFAKIIIIWELPKGNVAYMVFAFILATAIIQACQLLSGKHIYAWFFRNFSYISLPLLLMFWVGTAYRLCEYGITENRVYLFAMGIIVTFYVISFFFSQSRHYLYTAYMAITLLSVLTFIPGISARDLDRQFRQEKENTKSVSTSKYYYMQQPLSISLEEYKEMYTLSGSDKNTGTGIYYIKKEEKYFTLFTENGKKLYRINMEKHLNNCLKKAGIDILHPKKSDNPDSISSDIQQIKTPEGLIILQNVSIKKNDIYEINNYEPFLLLTIK